MKNYWPIGAIILVVSISGILFLYKPFQNSSANNTTATTGAQPDQTTPDNYRFIEQYKTAFNIFSCRIRPYTESNCELFVSDISGNGLKDLGINVDYGDFSKKIQGSPNGKNLLIVLESKAIILDTTTLAQKVVLNAPTGSVLGIYSGFPTFIPYAKWINNTQVQISLFRQNTLEPSDGEPSPTPLETRTISVI